MEGREKGREVVDLHDFGGWREACDGVRKQGERLRSDCRTEATKRHIISLLFIHPYPLL